MNFPSPIPSARVVDDPFELAGGTPLVQLRNVVPQGSANVWLKLDQLNPTGSTKDRVVEELLRGGEGQEFVVASTGNLGISVAAYGARIGARVTVVMPRGMSLERRATIRGYEAKLELTSAEGGLDEAVARARILTSERNAKFVDPFLVSNRAGAGLGTEILDAMRGLSLAAIVCTVGTGATLRALAQVLRAERSNVRVIAVEAASSPVLSRGEVGPSKIQGSSNSVSVRDAIVGLYGEVVSVADLDAHRMRTRLASEEGLLAGMSTGANVVAALHVAANLASDAHVVTLQCDSGERYFSVAEHFSDAP